MRMEGRRRLSRSSVDVHTLQLQPMVGTPTLVPDPKTVIATSGIYCRFFAGFHRLDVAEAQFGERILDQALLVHGQIALCFIREHCEQVDGVGREAVVWGGAVFVLPEVHES